jgi:NTP pyrophosphatase (non-canonical NTP hydrolase)
MTLNDYQQAAMSTAVFPTHDLMPIIYPALGLAGETGEVVDKIKKVIRNGGNFSDETKAEIAKELGDVLWYIAAMSRQLGFTLEQIGEMNIQKLADRKNRGVLKSEGDNR